MATPKWNQIPVFSQRSLFQPYMYNKAFYLRVASTPTAEKSIFAGASTPLYFSGVTQEKNAFASSRASQWGYKKTQWQMMSDTVNVSQQLAYDHSADEMLKYNTDLHEKQLAQGGKKKEKPTKKHATPETNLDCSLRFKPYLLPP